MKRLHSQHLITKFCIYRENQQFVERKFFISNKTFSILNCKKKMKFTFVHVCVIVSVCVCV